MITGVTIYSESSLKENCLGKTVDKKFITGKAVQIGDSPGDIIKKYGEPSFQKREDDLLVYEYHTDHKNDPAVRLYYDALLYFRDGKLVKFFIHDGN